MIKDQIKSLLKDLCEGVNESEDFELSILRYSSIPISPDLMSYCLDEILGFKIHYRPFEKVNYYIQFSYKGTTGYVSHMKLSYEIGIAKKFKDEFLMILEECRSLLEELFIELSSKSITENFFTMKNEYLYFDEKLDFYRKKIISLNEDLAKIGPSKPILYSDFARGLRDENNYKRRETRKEIMYSIETLIDTFYSFLEHILTLLYPFLKDFTISDSYGKYLQNSKWNWMNKIEEVLGLSVDTKLISILKEIKEIYRNRNAHGMFSRELEVYVGIDNYGQFPLFIGKNYLKGFTEQYDLTLDFEKFQEIDQNFNSFFTYLWDYYELPMMYISSGLPVQANIKSILSDIDTKEKMNNYIEYYSYQLDNQFNMDW